MDAPLLISPHNIKRPGAIPRAEHLPDNAADVKLRRRRDHAPRLPAIGAKPKIIAAGKNKMMCGIGKHAAASFHGTIHVQPIISSIGRAIDEAGRHCYQQRIGNVIHCRDRIAIDYPIGRDKRIASHGPVKNITRKNKKLRGRGTNERERSAGQYRIDKSLLPAIPLICSEIQAVAADGPGPVGILNSYLRDASAENHRKISIDKAFDQPTLTIINID